MARKDTEPDYLQRVKELVESIQYGSIQIIVQDGRVVQIDKTEKYRVKS